MIINKHKMQYWLGMGATCTNRVHRILEKFEMVPKTPTPYGAATLYPKPEKEYNMEYYHKGVGPKGNNRDHYLKQQL
jgi:hypothetical protein